MKKYYVLLLSMFTLAAFGQESPYKANNYFEQMGTSLPTPNTYRSASGAPGRDYWQQRADYKINVELDDVNQRLIGSETITYFNNSPEPLRYLWVQLDQNRFKDDALGKVTRGSDIDTKRGESMRSLSAIDGKSDKPYGYMITAVLDAAKRPLKYTINGTMMRVDLPAPLDNGKTFTFSIDWNHNIIEVRAQGGRGGYEFFEKDGNYLYEMAQWFPRMCVYDDVNGWQNKQFIGQGEFALVFGNYEVAITAPNDMVVGATGEIQNMDKVLSNEMKKRLKQAETSKIPVLIVNQSEAEAAEKGKPTGKKTWIFKAENVRDFAFAASRKFIWDAMKVDVEG
ncbi:MAG: M1 family peptidase, partial [Spirosomaceae bacterium]|nr:M1 family peptidase [Spirosomataceae bacterium]